MRATYTCTRIRIPATLEQRGTINRSILNALHLRTPPQQQRQTHCVQKLSHRPIHFFTDCCFIAHQHLTDHKQHQRSFTSSRTYQQEEKAASQNTSTTATQPQPAAHHSHEELDPNAPDVHVTFVEADGTRTPVTGKVGQSLLDLAHANKVELEGACEASLACSTCHVILPQSYYVQLSEPCDEENDMLDMAFGLTDTSRLGCQVKLAENLEGMEIQIPAATRNMMVDKQKGGAQSSTHT